MFFADFRKQSENIYAFEPCVVGCVGTPENLKRIVNGEKSPDSFFDAQDLETLYALTNLVVLTNDHGTEILQSMERNFFGTEIEVLSDDEAVLKYPGSVSGIKPGVDICTLLSRIRKAPEEQCEPTRDSEDKMSLILPNLYISNCYFPGNKAELDKRNIKRIVNVTATFPCHFPDDIKYMRVPINDRGDANISDYFYPAFVFINEGIENGEGVLVHCTAGISRSPTIVASYLMIKYIISSDDALALIQSRRDVIDINFGFAVKLKIFEVSSDFAIGKIA